MTDRIREPEQTKKISIGNLKKYLAKPLAVPDLGLVHVRGPQLPVQVPFPSTALPQKPALGELFLTVWGVCGQQLRRRL